MRADLEVRRLRRKLARAQAQLRALKNETPDESGVAVSPLAPKGGFPDLPVIPGVEFASVAAGVRYRGRTDVMLARLCTGTTIAGVTTRSATRSAPVLDCEEKLAMTPDLRNGAAIIVNSGNSNAFTGGAGQKSVQEITQAVATRLNIPQSRVFSSSTGVIGEPLPHERITSVLDELTKALSDTAISDAAHAIMTTDTFPKGTATEAKLGEDTIRIAGIAKGSGMVAPDMGTMLVYIFTDAKIDTALLQSILRRLTDRTFNAITVDSDTSTSDTLLVAATGQTGDDIVAGSANEAAFSDALHKVMRDLSHQVVRDGEGATKFIEVTVTGADSPEDARRCALAIANSPLVKTAAAGEDPNWGRIVMAVGKSGAKADRDLLSIRFGDILVAENGWVAESYREEDGVACMRADEIVIHVDLGLGEASDTVWTCDLTHGYISINADYRS
ncbi:bifunctional glutamate N-acetyltransferase/amino-acid acetyltransferase ArgJ [Qingshengfaniella alkalisoli]|uniref:Arginine biosynthesis bifunctional protein ArgJ n=1 Tax=Qingshengfaniella alkalisoli TaxID=2599296 RepID=A0A5B8IBA6_9RHOB|nr:bifunctional glutamate N-acetyltransferase/amino-acid acetyltransferase ArgJ [Qingshengfaniella alkalisoli]QDY71459.1 bifunctional glutamate N-acetyltransferase/amino-acid acetyltransferase ArgJ [Qingshengfaniella alkalisoli]